VNSTARTFLLGGKVRSVEFTTSIRGSGAPLLWTHQGSTRGRDRYISRGYVFTAANTASPTLAALCNAVIGRLWMPALPHQPERAGNRTPPKATADL